MADAQDLHQIEYRHHPTRDFSPFASSMTSPNALSAWDTWNRGWVRPPQAVMPTESVCYQVRADGQAALAWRYWDERAAIRENGTRGRPLVSRVLLGPATVLDFEVALALCRSGPSAKLLGSLPGQIPDGGTLPRVSIQELAVLAREVTPELDQAAAGQQGLQAVVAAALTEPSVPLAISVPGLMIREPPRAGIQCPLLWGLHAIARPLLGPNERPWSFSTWEAPLGEADPASLPAIVFREVRDAGKPPPARWRREARVRPFDADALGDGSPYAGLAEVVGWLVSEYQNRGRHELERFILARARRGESFAQRLERVSEEMRKASPPRRPMAPAVARQLVPAESDAPVPAVPPPVEQVPEVRQQAHAGGDANVAGRDLNIVYQYPDLSSEATALEELSAAEGAKLLAALSGAQETLSRARKVLTSVAPGVAAPALKVLLKRDEDLVIALLATINEAKATSLVDQMGPSGQGLRQLLEATEAITQCESAAYRDLGERDGRFMRAVSGRGTQGFRQKYANGAIHWSPDRGAFATTGAIAQCHNDAGGSEGLLGFPVASAVLGKHPRTSSTCSWQLFEGPTDYSTEVCEYLDVQCGATVVSSQEHGVHATWGGIGELSELGWHGRSALGLPVGDAIPIGPCPRTGNAGASGWRQRFEGGTAYYSDKTGTILVPSSWAGYLESQGQADGWIGFPVSPAQEAAASPYGTTGYYQRFEGTRDYPEDVVGRASDGDRPFGATICYSRQHGAHTVKGENGILHERLGGSGGWLGFPASDEVDASLSADDPGRTIQRFEGGAIFHARKYGSVPVRLEVIDYLSSQSISSERVGFPVRESEPLASGNDDCIQFFEHSIVTIQDNLIQVWFDAR